MRSGLTTPFLRVDKLGGLDTVSVANHTCPKVSTNEQTTVTTLQIPNPSSPSFSQPVMLFPPPTFEPGSEHHAQTKNIRVKRINIATKEGAKLTETVRFWETAQAQKQNKRAHNSNVFPGHHV